jgi:uncharacterized protein YndB with AHSA1/START domain
MKIVLICCGALLAISCGHSPSRGRLEGDRMNARTVLHISVSIDRPPAQVYEFASNPENVPKWATGLSGAITQVNGEWFSESPMGKVKVKFAERNALGVLDHQVTLPSGVTINNPMRVVPNQEGSEVVFTLFRQPDVTDPKFAEDAAWVRKDLAKLKAILEN